MAEYFRPAHVTFDAFILPARHATGEFIGALQAIGQLLRAIRLTFEHLAQLGNFRLRLRVGLTKSIAFADRFAGHAGVVLNHYQTQIARRLVECACRFLQVLEVACMLDAGQPRIARELD